MFKLPKQTQKTDVKKNMKVVLIAFVGLFALLGGYLLYSTVAYGQKWFSTPFNPRISASKNIDNAGDIYDRKGVLLAHSVDGERKYADSEDVRRAVSHIVGDVYGKSMGAETYYAKYLYGYEKGLQDKIAGVLEKNQKGADIYLTIDAELSEYIYDNMDYNGAVVLFNYKTGEVLASVSKPTFDPNKIKNDEDNTGSKYVNRATQGKYPPGSTMKIVTTLSALEARIDDYTYFCEGADVIEGQRITCPKKGGHGEVDLKGAFKSSCNIYYAQLAVKLGESRLKKTAEKFGYNYEFNFPDFDLYKSSFELSGNKGDLAWAGIGQYKDLTTPMHAMMFAAAIGNDGVIMQPNTLHDVKYGDKSAFNYSPSEFRRVTSPQTAEIIADFMAEAVKSGTATSANIDGKTMHGKTGTAEYYEDGGVKNHSWFVGYLEESPLAIGVILEGAGFGSAHATPLAKKVINKALNLGY